MGKLEYLLQQARQQDPCSLPKQSQNVRFHEVHALTLEGMTDRVLTELMSPPVATSLLSWIGLVLAACTAAYACLSLWAWFRCERRNQHRRADVNDQASRPVSVLKPLHGAEPGLYENLKGFCKQTHAHYEILFGVRDGADPAIPIVQRLQQEFPELPMALVIDP